MKEYLENLKLKFNYSDSLINFLEKAIPAIISYYGEGSCETVLRALANCEIHIQEGNEDTSQYLNKFWGKNEDTSIPFLAGAFYNNGISIKDNNIITKPLIYIRTVYSHQYKPFNFDDDESLDSLLHEILHAIKEYGKVKVKDNKIFTSTGLNQSVYSYDDLGNIKEEANIYIGIEEAFNVAATSSILSMITGREQKFRGYSSAGYLANAMLSNQELAAVIKNSQLSGDTTWIQYFGDSSEQIIKSFDILINMMYLSQKEVINKELRMKKIEDARLAREFLESFITMHCNWQFNFSERKPR